MPRLVGRWRRRGRGRGAATGAARAAATTLALALLADGLRRAEAVAQGEEVCGRAHEGQIRAERRPQERVLPGGAGCIVTEHLAGAVLTCQVAITGVGAEHRAGAGRVGRVEDRDVSSERGRVSGEGRVVAAVRRTG